MALDATQVQEILENDGYPALFEGYERAAPLYTQIAEVVDPNSAGMPLYGDKGSVFQNMERFKEREDGQPVSDSTIDKGWTWQSKIRVYSRRLTIYRRVREANDPGAVKADIMGKARSWGELAALQKDDFVAGMFQKGTLTAGSTTYFDNSYANNADSNAGFIYDGLPWFDTAHTVSGGSSTYANHVVSSALTEANLKTAMTAMTSTNAVDERGERIIVRPTHLIVPPGLQFTAHQILKSTLLPGGSNNDVNPLKDSMVPVVWRALSDAASTSSWWMVEARKGLRVYDSGMPTLRLVEERNGDLTIVAEYYFGAAVTNWRFAYCANKAAS